MSYHTNAESLSPTAINVLNRMIAEKGSKMVAVDLGVAHATLIRAVAGLELRVSTVAHIVSQLDIPKPPPLPAVTAQAEATRVAAQKELDDRMADFERRRRYVLKQEKTVKP